MRQVVLERFIERGEQSTEDRQLVRSLSVETAERPSAPATPADVAVPPVDTSSHPAAEHDGVPVDDMPESMRLMLFLAEALVNQVGTAITLDKDGIFLKDKGAKR